MCIKTRAIVCVGGGSGVLEGGICKGVQQCWRARSGSVPHKGQKGRGGSRGTDKVLV